MFKSQNHRTMDEASHQWQTLGFFGRGVCIYSGRAPLGAIIKYVCMYVCMYGGWPDRTILEQSEKKIVLVIALFPFLINFTLTETTPNRGVSSHPIPSPGLAPAHSQSMRMIMWSKASCLKGNNMTWCRDQFYRYVQGCPQLFKF